MERKKIKKILPPFVFLIVLLLGWQFGFTYFEVPNYLYPTPIKILKALLSDKTLFQHAYVTAIEMIIGFLLATTLGFLFAIFLGFSKTMENALMPYVVLMQVTPIIVIAPLIVLWFGNGILAKIIVSAFISFFPILVNTLKGLKLVEKNYYRLFQILGASRIQQFFHLRLPTCLPYFFSGLKIAAPLSIIGAVVGEFVGANRGLGYYILLNSYQLKTSTMFAAVILSGAVGYLFYWIISYLERRYVFWIKET